MQDSVSAVENVKRENLAMHIAVCDDNVGDRKQLERLLKRESDKRAHDTGVFYVDSYGNADAVMKSPMLYDVFFIDMTDSDINGTQLATLLLNAGVTVPIIFCISCINYRQVFHCDPEKNQNHIFYLEKPLKKAELSDTLDKCILLKSQNVSAIELRGEHMTRYVFEDDIVYSQAVGNYIHIHLLDNTEIEILSTVDNFYSQLSAYTHYAAISRKAMVNTVHIRKLTPFKITLFDGTVLSTTPSYYAYIKKAFR